MIRARPRLQLYISHAWCNTCLISDKSKGKMEIKCQIIGNSRACQLIIIVVSCHENSCTSRGARGAQSAILSVRFWARDAFCRHNLITTAWRRSGPPFPRSLLIIFIKYYSRQVSKFVKFFSFQINYWFFLSRILEEYFFF